MYLNLKARRLGRSIRAKGWILEVKGKIIFFRSIAKVYKEFLLHPKWLRLY